MGMGIGMLWYAMEWYGIVLWCGVACYAMLSFGVALSHRLTPLQHQADQSRNNNEEVEDVPGVSKVVLSRIRNVSQSHIGLGPFIRK